MIGAVLRFLPENKLVARGRSPLWVRIRGGSHSNRLKMNLQIFHAPSGILQNRVDGKMIAIAL